MSDNTYIQLLLIQRFEHWRDDNNYDADSVEETYLYAGTWGDARIIVDGLNAQLDEKRNAKLAAEIVGQKKVVAEQEKRYKAQAELTKAEQKLLGVDPSAAKRSLDWSKENLKSLEDEYKSTKIRYRKEGESYWNLDVCSFASNFYFEPHIHTGEPVAVFKPDFKVEN